MDIKSVTDESLPQYVRDAAAKDEKWKWVYYYPSCYQLLTDEQRYELENS